MENVVALDQALDQAIELYFGEGNAKLDKSVATFSLPAGHSCPFADLCRSAADKLTGKVKDGPNTLWRCFSASAEWNQSVRNSRWNNWQLLLAAKTIKAMAALIETYLPAWAKWVRIHVSGDFYNESYFLAWVEVARNNPNIVFYAYTKALGFWTKNLASIPSNLILTASRGGTQDHLIKEFGLREAVVVFDVKQAAKLGLEIDHDDSHAMVNGPSFALLLHGTQPAGSEAAVALKALRSQGIGGYGKDAAKRKTVVAA